MTRLLNSRTVGGAGADQVVEVNVGVHHTKGYLFTKGRNWQEAEIADFEDKCTNCFEGLHTIWPDLFKPGIDMTEANGLFRLLWHGSNTKAIWNKLDSIIIDMRNPWWKFERKGVGCPLPLCNNTTCKYREYFQCSGSTPSDHCNFSQFPLSWLRGVSPALNYLM